LPDPLPPVPVLEHAASDRLATGRQNDRWESFKKGEKLFELVVRHIEAESHAGALKREYRTTVAAKTTGPHESAVSGARARATA
jgi:hypothetical protein